MLVIVSVLAVLGLVVGYLKNVTATALPEPPPAARRLTVAGRPAIIDDLLARCSFPRPGTDVVCAFSGGPTRRRCSPSPSRGRTATSRRSTSTTACGRRRPTRPTAAGGAGRPARCALPGRRAPTSPPAPTSRHAPGAARQAVLPAGALTGHTADDRAETLLVNLLRGAGLDGLAAMAPGPTRPLLALRRAETAPLCAELGLVPVGDPSNDDPRFVRNRVRHELLPLMDSIAGRDTVPLLVRTAETAADDAALAESLAAESTRPTPGRSTAAAPAARPPSTAAMADDRRLPARRGHHRPRPRRRRRRADGRASCPAATASNVTASGCASCPAAQ